MTLAELQEYYAGLLIVQYRTKPKAIAQVKLLSNCALCDLLLQSEQECFDLDTAIGAQLDILGRIVGVPRNIYGLDLEHDYHNFTTYNTNADCFGFCLYDANHEENFPLFLRYNSDAVYQLTDEELRLLIRLKIIINNGYSSFKMIKEAIYESFEGDIAVEDNKDMTITYTINEDLSNAAAAAIYLGLLPKPAGVKAIANYV